MTSFIIETLILAVSFAQCICQKHIDHDAMDKPLRDPALAQSFDVNVIPASYGENE